MKNLEKMQFLVRWPPYYKTYIWRTLNGPPLRRFLRKAIFAVTFAQKVPKKICNSIWTILCPKKALWKSRHTQTDGLTDKQTDNSILNHSSRWNRRFSPGTNMEGLAVLLTIVSGGKTKFATRSGSWLTAQTWSRSLRASMSSLRIFQSPLLRYYATILSQKKQGQYLKKMQGESRGRWGHFAWQFCRELCICL